MVLERKCGSGRGGRRRRRPELGTERAELVEPEDRGAGAAVLADLHEGTEGHETIALGGGERAGLEPAGVVADLAGGVDPVRVAHAIADEAVALAVARLRGVALGAGGEGHVPTAERVRRDLREDHVHPIRPADSADRHHHLADLLVAGEVEPELGLLLDERLPDLVRLVVDEPDVEELPVDPADLADDLLIAVDGVEAPELLELLGGRLLLDDLVRLAGDPDQLVTAVLLGEEREQLGEGDDLDGFPVGHDIFHRNTCFVLNTRERSVHYTPPETGLQ